MSSNQPPSGGCVLKQPLKRLRMGMKGQPPSGGCVLKHQLTAEVVKPLYRQPPSGGCVLKPRLLNSPLLYETSRLQAAVC